MFARVIVDISKENVDKLFTYNLGNVKAVCGQRVLVPFGKGNKPIEGFILELSETAENTDIEYKYIIRTLEDYAATDENQITLAKWISKAYHCTMAQALRLMIPAQLRGMRINEKKQRCVKLSDNINAENYLASLISKNGNIRNKSAYATVEFLMQMAIEVAVCDLYKLVPGCNNTTVKKLIDSGILTECFNTVFRRPRVLSTQKQSKPVLNSEQLCAYNEICDGLNNFGGSFLLHGVTGSGKTEVYMQAIEHAVEMGKGAIVLVPEISLTPQTVERFTQRFKNNVAVLHSRLSAGERFDEWRRIRLGLVNVVVGARSAVFAPVNNLGIIIIDEEHEGAYFSEKIPRYSATEVAQKRCSLCNGVLVLGSATPAVTTYFKAQLNKYKLLTLKNRVNTMPLPRIETVDMRTEFLSGNNGIFSECLKQRLSDCITAGQQAILFLNRRGYSNFVSCRACGHVFECCECDVSMTYHKFDNTLKCHYCGNESAVPKTCPKCGKAFIKFTGIGTQQIEDEIKKLFPNTACIRMDADTTKGKDSHLQLLSEFANGKAQILIGTQMIAKGLDFPNVTLVGVVSVDAMLAMPDFRNTERTFQLLTQVAGRAGRANKEGIVVLQTSNPLHPVLEFAKTHDYESFYNYAIQNRLSNMYPPYSVFVRILFCGDDDEKVRAESVECATCVYSKLVDALKEKKAALGEIMYIYAMPAPIRRIQSKQRHHVLLKLARTKNTASLINEIYSYANECNLKFLSSIEVNPSDML